MINENFINFNFEPNYMDHDDTYPHKHHHTPAKLASHEYQECMHKKKNEKKCKEDSLRVYENNISAEQEFINCMDGAKTTLDKRVCNNTFNKDNKYSHTSAYGSYEQLTLKRCMTEELKENIEKICGNCEKKSKNTETSIGEDMYYNNCIKNKKKCENKYDNAKKCIENLKAGQYETQECLDDIRFTSLYGPCYEQKGINIGGIIGKILKYLIGPLKKGIFYFIYFGFTVMSALIFGGSCLYFVWLLYKKAFGLPRIKTLKWGFPGIIIDKILDFLMWFEKHGVQLFFLLWTFLFGICLTLYFFKKFFGKWPAIWVWKAIGIFPGNEKQVFNWFDRMFGCMTKIGRKSVFCHTNNHWILMEDWMVEFAQTFLKTDKTEVEIRNAINAIRDLGDDDIKVEYSIEKIIEETKKKGNKVSNEQIDNNKEEFTLCDRVRKPYYIEENFIDLQVFDNITNEIDNFKLAINDMRTNEVEKTKSQEDFEKEQKDREAQAKATNQ